MADPPAEVAADHGTPARYVIRVRGQLGDRWGDRFDRFTLVRDADGTTVLDGSGVDQAALHGALRTLADLGLTLLSVTPVDASSSPHDPTETPSPS